MALVTLTQVLVFAPYAQLVGSSATVAGTTGAPLAAGNTKAKETSAIAAATSFGRVDGFIGGSRDGASQCLPYPSDASRR